MRPLLFALWRNPTGAILVTLQVAITLAVLVNAAWIASQHIEQVEQPTGFDTRDTFAIDMASLTEKFNVGEAESEDLAYLRSLPGVAAVTLSIGIPLTGYGSANPTFWRQPGQRGGGVTTNVLYADEQTLTTLGVSLVAGRNFRADEIQPLATGKQTQTHSSSGIILTSTLARALFPGGSALGKTIYDSENDPLTVVGISHDFMGAICGGCGMPLYNTALMPQVAGDGGYYAYLVRTLPGRRDALLRAALQHIGAAHRDGVIHKAMTLSQAKEGFESDDRNMAIFLTAITAVMLAVCCLGIFGLTTFNVGSRTRQIGTRRAVGARQRDIVAHFMMENAIILIAGALLGTVLALALGYWLTTHYGLPRLNLAYLLAGLVIVGTIGELAAWQPARRAASVAPSVATRTV